MNENGTLLLYGATGYTGQGIVTHLVASGIRPVLAGRNEKKLQQLGSQFGLNYEVFDADDKNRAIQILGSYDVLLNSAGPIEQTCATLVDACLETGTHYLDITPEIKVYDYLLSRTEEAHAADVMIMPGIGFDMVPGDCLSLMLKERLPDACDLSVAYRIEGSLTRGTMRSALLAFGSGVFARRDNQLCILEQPMSRTFDFGDDFGGKTECLPASFADPVTDWFSTGIPNIASYVAVIDGFQTLETISSIAAIDDMPSGPPVEELHRKKACVVAEARNARGDMACARMLAPHGYLSTFIFAAGVAKKVLGGSVIPGYQTPSRVFGSRFLREFEDAGVSIEHF